MLPSASARFIRHTGRAPREIAIEKARWLLGWDRSPRSKRGRARRKSGAGSPRLLRVKEKGHFALRPARSLPLAVALSWPQFLAALLTLYLSVNLVFAVLYWAVPGSVANVRPHSLADTFFFSIETLATVGYGEMYPATLYGRVVAASEIVCGIAFTAILTGLTFVRFSRPRAKLIFAANPVVAMHNGKPTLMVRIGNGRVGVLTDVAAKLNVFFFDTLQGMPFRRAQELRLERTHIPVFTIFWTLMHVLDELAAFCTAADGPNVQLRAAPSGAGKTSLIAALQN